MNNSGIEIRYRGIAHLKPLLQKWINMNESYCKKFVDDALYWYNERTTLGTVAGAVLKCGEFSLEEHRTLREYREEAYTGRADLWFSWKRTTYQAEAKQIWVSLSGRAKKSTQYIKKALQSARQDAVRISESDRGRALGIVFVVPRISLSEKDEINSALKTFIKEVKQVDYDFIAYTFPKLCRALKSGNYTYPGVVLVGRTSKRK